MKVEKILLKEYQKVIANISELEGELGSLPKGSVCKKRISGKEYYYLQYREGASVKSEYICPANINEYTEKTNRRKEIQKELKPLYADKEAIEKVIGDKLVDMGQMITYRPVKSVDYDSYTMFMSQMAHEVKRLGKRNFLSKYQNQKIQGINGRYLKGLINYLENTPGRARKGASLVLDPYTYQMYFKYKDKDVLKESLERAIPQFLRQGLLVTEVQEAVSGAFS